MTHLVVDQIFQLVQDASATNLTYNHDIYIGRVIPEVSSDSLLFLYLQGLQLLEAFAGKNQNWLICSKHFTS